MYSHYSDGVTDSVESADDADLDSFPWDMSDVENAADLPPPTVSAAASSASAASPASAASAACSVADVVALSKYLLESSGGDIDKCDKEQNKKRANMYSMHCQDNRISPYNRARARAFMHSVEDTRRDRLRVQEKLVEKYVQIKDAEKRSAFIQEHPDMPMLPEMAQLGDAVACDDTSEELSTYLLRNGGHNAVDIQNLKNTKHTKMAVNVFKMLCDDVRVDPRGSQSRAKAFMQAVETRSVKKMQTVEKLTAKFVSLTDRDHREAFLKDNQQMIYLEEEERPQNPDSLAELSEVHHDVRAERQTGCLRLVRTDDGGDTAENTDIQVNDEHTGVARRRTRVSKRQRDDTDKGAEDEDKDEDVEDDDEDADDDDEDVEDKDEDAEDEDAEDEDEDVARPRTRGAKRQCVVHAASVDDDAYDTVTAGAMRILKECDPSISQAALEYAWARSGLRTQVAELRSTLAHLAAEHEAQEAKARNELVAMATKNVTQLLAMSKRTGVLLNQPELKSLLRQLDARVTGVN